MIFAKGSNERNENEMLRIVRLTIDVTVPRCCDKVPHGCMRLLYGQKHAVYPFLSWPWFWHCVSWSHMDQGHAWFTELAGLDCCQFDMMLDLFVPQSCNYQNKKSVNSNLLAFKSIIYPQKTHFNAYINNYIVWLLSQVGFIGIVSPWVN